MPIAKYYENGKLTALVTYQHTYFFGGFKFEYSNFLGPTKLNKNGEQSAQAGRRFYLAVSQWEKLSKEEKEKTRI